jgi:uncharacterized membrane protein YgdD (TMEM256/DUF423 family)
MRKETLEEMTGVFLITGWALFVGVIIFFSLVPKLIFGARDGS